MIRKVGAINKDKQECEIGIARDFIYRGRLNKIKGENNEKRI